MKVNAKVANGHRTAAGGVRLQCSACSRSRHLLAACCLLGLAAHRSCGWDLTRISVAHVVAQSLLPGTMVLPALVRALVRPPPLAGTGLVTQLLAVPLEAVVLPAIVPDADLKRPTALEAQDLVEIDQIGAHHVLARRI